MANHLLPYIFFYGRCEEALEFYKGVFGGNFEIMRNADTPMADQMPPGSAHKVMHASFKADTVSFMASDGREEKPIDPDAGNVSLALEFDDATGGERTFNALAQGGKISMPIDQAFWGGRFGMVVDKFGNEWMLSLP